MKKPRVLIFSGYGLNSEVETKFAFDVAGGNAEIVHINDLISKKKKLSDYQILRFPEDLLMVMIPAPEMVTPIDLGIIYGKI